MSVVSRAHYRYLTCVTGIVVCLYTDDWRKNLIKLHELIGGVSRRLALLARKIEYASVDKTALKYTDCFETVKVLTQFIKPKSLCDIGANRGQWAYVLQQLSPRLEHVVFFEPQAKLKNILEDLPLGSVNKSICQCALGDNDGDHKLTGGTPSASLLSASEIQHNYFPESLEDEYEIVKSCKLDNVYEQNNFPDPDVIKIDVQGYELNVLKNGTNLLSKTKFLVIELPFQEFYVGQPSLWKLLQFIEEQGFVFVDYGYKLRSRESPSLLLQADGIFANKKLVQLN